MAPSDSMVMHGLFPVAGPGPRQRRRRVPPRLAPEQLTPTEVNPRMAQSSGRVRQVGQELRRAWCGAGDPVAEEESTCPEIPSLREQTLVDGVPEFLVACSRPEREDATLQDPPVVESTSPFLAGCDETEPLFDDDDDTDTNTCPFPHPRAVGARGAGGPAQPLPPLQDPASRSLAARPRAPAAAAQPAHRAPARHVDTLPIASSARSERVCSTDQIEFELDEESVCAPRTRGWVGPLLLTVLLAACGAAYVLLRLGAL